MEVVKSMTLTCAILFVLYFVSSYLVLAVNYENNIRIKQNINTSVRIMLN